MDRTAVWLASTVRSSETITLYEPASEGWALPIVNVAFTAPEIGVRVPPLLPTLDGSLGGHSVPHTSHAPI